MAVIDLPRSTLIDLNKAARKLLDAQAALDKLENAGSDVSEARAIVKSWQDTVDAHKREFFPDAR